MCPRWLRSSLAVPLLLALVTACAAPPPPPPSPPVVHPAAAVPATTTVTVTPSATDDANAATVYIYRPKAFVGFALRPTVTLDGQDLINVKNGTVWVGKFTPGIYKIQMDDKKSGAEVDMKPGLAYYFRVDIVPGFWKGGGRMTMMAKEQGSLEIQGLDPLPKDEVEHPSFKGM